MEAWQYHENLDNIPEIDDNFLSPFRTLVCVLHRRFLPVKNTLDHVSHSTGDKRKHQESLEKTSPPVDERGSKRLRTLSMRHGRPQSVPSAQQDTQLN